MRWALAVAWSLKPALGLARAVSDPGILEGSNSSGVPHLLPSVTALVLLGGGWYLLLARDYFFRLFGWIFLIGASMFSSVMLSTTGLRSVVTATMAVEWLSLVGVLVALVVRLFVGLDSSDPSFRRVSAFAISVLVITVLAPLAALVIAALAASPLYVFTVSTVSYGGLPALLFLLWRLQQRLEAS